MLKNWLCSTKLEQFLLTIHGILRRTGSIDRLRTSWMDVLQGRSIAPWLRQSFIIFEKSGEAKATSPLEIASWYLPHSSFFLCPTPQFRLLMRSFFLHPSILHIKESVSLTMKPRSKPCSLGLIVKAQIQMQWVLNRSQMVVFQWMVLFQWVLVAIRRKWRWHPLRYKLQLIIWLLGMENNVPQAESCGYLQLCWMMFHTFCLTLTLCLMTMEWGEAPSLMCL